MPLLASKTANWALPPQPRWDVTDCGLGEFDQIGLVLLNLSEQPEYCEKLMYSKSNQVTPMHTHRKKKGGHHLPQRAIGCRALEASSGTDGERGSLFDLPQWRASGGPVRGTADARGG